MLNPEEMLRLSSQLCFSLYACSKEIIRLYKPYLDPHGLTYTQYITLLALWESDGLRVNELGERLTLDSGTLTPLLKKLERMGLITRQRASADERSVVAALTEQGRALKNEFFDLPQRMFCHTGLTADEAAALKALSDGLLMRLRTTT